MALSKYVGPLALPGPGAILRQPDSASEPFLAWRVQAVALSRLQSELTEQQIKGDKTMATRTGSAVWEGTLKEGKGTMKLGSGAFDGPYSFSSRFEEAKGTNPEELIGAAEAGCYSMALSANLEKAGHPVTRISTTATVKLEMVEGAPKITTIDLKTTAQVPGIDETKFNEIAEQTRKGCPVSKALAGTQINLEAKLL
jgi:lipoyl-dependent peroxiredoxin